MKFNWKIGGEAGFGIMTSGLAFSKIATRSGYHIYDYAEYPSLIRGGHNTYEVVFSDEPMTAPQWMVDMLVCLNEDTYLFHVARLHAESIVVYDPDVFTPTGKGIFVPVPFKKLKKEHTIHQQMVNTIALGVSLGLLGAQLTHLENIIREEFGRKGDDVVTFNIKLAQVGFDYVKDLPQVKPILVQQSNALPKIVVTGNDAYSIATIAADCRYYAAYPMTPSSTVLSTLAGYQYDTGMVVRHSEDEIAVISSALGAAYAGVRSSVGTSGGGFALMVESISYAGVAEIPITVFLSMRPGPATGMPTWTEQGDLHFAVHAGHGEFPKMVFAPGDVEEMIELTKKAFDVADIYQTATIVLSDKMLSESHQDIDHAAALKHMEPEPNRGKIVSQTAQETYLRYKDSPDGISEMLIPGQKGQFYQANSYEHLEDSHTTEDGEAVKLQVDKRERKVQTYLKNHFVGPSIYGDAKAEIVFVSWGSMKGVLLAAQKLLKEEHNIATKLIHFTHIFPMDEAKVKSAFADMTSGKKRYILIENNSQAQFGQLLRMLTGIDLTEKMLKYDGRPFWAEEIVSYVTGAAKPPVEVLNLDPTHEPDEQALIDKLQLISHE